MGAALTIDRLRSSEVAFIKAQQAEDVKLVRGLRATAEQQASMPMSAVPRGTSAPAAAAATVSRRRSAGGGGHGEIELADISRPLNEDTSVDAEAQPGVVHTSSMDLAAGMLSGLSRQMEAQKWFGWLRLRRMDEHAKHFGLSGGASFPQICQVLSLEVVLLSADHMLLLVGFGLGIATLIMQASSFSADDGVHVGMFTQADDALWLLP